MEREACCKVLFGKGGGKYERLFIPVPSAAPLNVIPLCILCQSELYQPQMLLGRALKMAIDSFCLEAAISKSNKSSWRSLSTRFRVGKKNLRARSSIGSGAPRVWDKSAIAI